MPVVTALFVDIEKLSTRYDNLYKDDAETYDYSYKTVKDKYDGLKSTFEGITLPPAELNALASAESIQAWIDANSAVLAQAELDIAAADALIPGQSTQFASLYADFVTDGYEPEISAHYFFINAEEKRFTTEIDDTEAELSTWCVPTDTIQEINVTINDNGRSEDGSTPTANITQVVICT